MGVRVRRVLAAIAASVLLVGIVAPATQASTSTAKKNTTATALLNTLKVEPESTAPYNRDDYKHWITTDGCDTREWVLIRQKKGGDVVDCEVVGGTWYSAYDGKTTSDPSTFDIDHMVPLGQANASGAASWSPARKQAFANDLSYAPSLIAVTASTNRSKSDQDPAEWMPPLKSDWCPYLKNWVGIKYRWGLSVDSAEKAFIAANLKPCDQKMKVPPKSGVK